MTAPQHEHQLAQEDRPVMSNPDSDEQSKPKPPARWTGLRDGWFSYRYPHTNGYPHKIKQLRYPPNGNVDEWVDNGDTGSK